MTFDLAAEKLLVLTLVNEPAAWDYASHLEPEMFGDALAQSAFRAAKDLVLAGLPVTPVNVQAEMGKAGSVVPKWTDGRKADLADVPALSERIRELWCRREWQKLGTWLSEYADKENTRDLANEIARVQSLTQRGGGRCRSMAELLLDFMAELEADAARPLSRVAFQTGYPRFDRNTGGLRPGVLNVFAARPGNGKTSFVMGILAHLAHTGVSSGAFWLEDDWRDALRRYLQRRYAVPGKTLRGTPREALDAIKPIAGSHADERGRLFVDDTHGLTVNDIAARMRRMAREHGVRVFVADHLGEMSIERGDRWGDRHDLALGKAARVFRDTAKDLGAAAILIAQMNRAVEKRTDGQPKMSDLDGSGQIEQAARVIAFLSRPVDANGEATGDYYVDLTKNTYGEVGRIPMRWHGDTMTVTE